MAKTGPQKYPGASTAHWYQGTYGGDAMETNVIVWHSTEGTSLPTYSGGAVAPNITAVPDFKAKKIVWYQHFDFDVSARALVHAGAVATNTLNVAQVEVVGTCDPSTHAKWTKAGYPHLYMAALPDWAIRDLAAFARWAHEQHGVPLSSGLAFKAYPGSYGSSNGVRMSDKQWLAFKGHCGHQHVPSGNVHGDPGDFPMSAILNEAKGGGGGSTGGSSSKPKYEPFPGAGLFMKGNKPAIGKKSPIFKAMGARLIAKGFKKYYRVGASDELGEADVNAYEAFQRSLGYTGSAATWPPGKDSWTELEVPNV